MRATTISFSPTSTCGPSSTATEGNSFDANGNFITSDLPSTPNYTLSSLDLTPGQDEFPVINLPGYTDDGSFLVALFDVEYSPDGSLSDAIDLGQAVYSTDQPVTAPEPEALVLLGTGMGILLLGRCSRFFRK